MRCSFLFETQDKVCFVQSLLLTETDLSTGGQLDSSTESGMHGKVEIHGTEESMKYQRITASVDINC